MIKYFFIILFFSTNILSREIGQTEIITDDGIEVFQIEKYYLLKKNVQITSDTFNLRADLVKAYFEKDLYDIVKIESNGNVTLKSSKGILAKGKQINFSIKNENIEIFGKKSILIKNDLKMYSNQEIKVDNLSGKFSLKGKGSQLKTDNIEIIGTIINGKYITINDVNEVQNLYVEDDEQSTIIEKDIKMFALKAIYNKFTNIIELFDNVKIIRNNETIIGDYAEINTLTESYKVKSNNTKKVKALITKTNE